MSIGTAWAAGAWNDASWAVGAWFSGIRVVVTTPPERTYHLLEHLRTYVEQFDRRTYIEPPTRRMQ